MLGTLLRMSGFPTRDEFEDLLLRWIVVGHDGVPDDEDEEHEPTDPNSAKVGNLLARAFVSAFWSEDHDGALLSGRELENTIFKSWKAGFVPRMRRACEAAGVKFEERFTDDDLAERFGLHWIESASMGSLELPTRQVRKIGQALGENEAAATLAMWDYLTKMDKAGVSV